MSRQPKSLRISLSILFTVIVGYLFYPAIVTPIFNFDSLRFFTVDHIQNVYGLDYFTQIFAHATNGPQYRPLSFFVYQLVTKSLFQDHLWLYQCIGFLFVLGICWYLLKICEKLKVNYYLSLFACLLFVLHPYSLLSHGNDMFFKYHSSLIIFLFGFYEIIKKPSMPKKSQYYLSILLSLAILMHEGAIVFPFAWAIIYLIPFKRRRFKKFWAPFIPSIVYLVIRFGINQAPSEGFMKVGTENIFSTLLYYFDTAWNIPFHTYFNRDKVDIYWVRLGKLLIVITLSLIFYIKTQKKILFKFLLINLILIAPFSVLPNHIIFNRSYWTYPLFSLFSVIIIQQFLKNKVLKISVIALMLLPAIHTNYQHRGYYETDHNARYNKLKNLSDSIISKLQNNQRKLIGIQVDLMRDLGGWQGPNTAVPSFLAIELPKDKTFLTYISHKGKVTKVLIYQGSYYHIKKHQGNKLIVNDMYNKQHRFEVAGISKIMSPNYRLMQFSL